MLLIDWQVFELYRSYLQITLPNVANSRLRNTEIKTLANDSQSSLFCFVKFVLLELKF